MDLKPDVQIQVKVVHHNQLAGLAVTVNVYKILMDLKQDVQVKVNLAHLLDHNVLMELVKPVQIHAAIMTARA